MKDMNAAGCSHADELITVLYNEATEAESKSFRQHMLACSQCAQEFEAFRDIRQPIVAWRNESLGIAAAPNVASTVENRKPSAVMALREFFAWSPNWLRGAVAFASVVFCVLAFLTLARLRENPAPPMVEKMSYTKDELESLVEARTQARIAELTATKTPESEVVAAVNDQPVISSPPTIKRIQSQSANGSRTRRPLSRQEREQLAADLRLMPEDEEADLDLLGDRLNQQDD